VVVGREVSPGEQRLFAYFVASARPPLTAGLIRDALARKLPDYMIPSVFVALDAIPQTPNGKTDRLGLPMPAKGDGNSQIASIVPRSAIEAELASMWADVLGVDTVGIDDTFLDLGGDSLRAAMLAARVTARYNLDLPMRALLDFGTVAKMAASVASSIENRDDGLRRPRLTGADITAG
jgi:acyl carrier protein